jgi:hypothetical protein
MISGAAIGIMMTSTRESLGLTEEGPGCLSSHSGFNADGTPLAKRGALTLKEYDEEIDDEEDDDHGE